MKKKKQDSAITLIALIITIIVLLMLAGVTISTLTGENGLLNRAKSANEENNKTNSKEVINILIMEYKTYSTNNQKDTSLKDLKEYLSNKDDVDNSSLILYWDDTASITDGLDTFGENNPKYLKMKLKKYIYVYTINSDFEIIEREGEKIEDNSSSTIVADLDTELTDLLKMSGTQLELNDILTSTTLMEKILHSNEASEYIFSDKECLEIIKTNSGIQELIANSNYASTNLLNVNVKALVPQLTSNTGTNGTASCSSSFGVNWDAWIAFCNKTNGDGWYPVSSPSWIQYKFNEPMYVKSIYLNAQNGFDGTTPNAKLQYSVDGINYVDATDYFSCTSGTDINKNTNTVVMAQYWRLYLTTGIRLYKFQLYGGDIKETIDSYYNDSTIKDDKDKVNKLLLAANISKIEFLDILNSQTFMEKMYNNEEIADYIINNKEKYMENISNSKLGIKAISSSEYMINKILEENDWKNSILNSTFKNQIAIEVPMMTSNTTPSGIAFASSEFSPAYNAFWGKDAKDEGWNSSGGPSPMYVGYDFGENVIIYKAVVQGHSNWLYDDWKIQAYSEENNNWYDISDSYYMTTNFQEIPLNQYAKSSKFRIARQSNLPTIIRRLQFYGIKVSK